MLEGSVHAGEPAQTLAAGQVGWLDHPANTGTSVLRLSGGGKGARALLYAGLPTRDPIVVQGPFVGDTRRDISRVYREYLAGRFVKMSELAQEALSGS